MMQKANSGRGSGISVRLKLFNSDGGTSLIEMALLLPILFLLLMGTVDFGRAYYLEIEVSRAAHTGALYGSQNPTDLAGMQSAATLDAADVSGLAVTSAYGYECSDGTQRGASCSSTGCATTPVAPTSCGFNAVYYIQVNTSVSYSATFPYPGIPTPIVLRGQATMRAGP
jgi:Flp pilus assembly protein TadG